MMVVVYFPWYFNVIKKLDQVNYIGYKAQYQIKNCFCFLSSLIVKGIGISMI